MTGDARSVHGLGRHDHLGQRLVCLLFQSGQIQIARLLIQICGDHCCVCVRHHVTLTFTTLNLTRVLLRDGLADDVVMVDLQLSLFICSMKGVLEVACDSLLAKLFLDTVDNRHDSLDVTIKNIADL